MEKIKIYPYSPKFPKFFEREKKKISKAINNNDIHHIGSTAVPRLGGKGIIDIMIGIKDWKETEDVVKELRTISFKHIYPKKKGIIFLSTKKNTTLGDFHVHIVKRGSKQYKNFLMFRDYLKKNKKEAKRFFKLKQEWFKKAKGDRDKYNKLKGYYVKEILKKSKFNSKINL